MEMQRPELAIHIFNNEDLSCQIFSFTSGLRELSILATVCQSMHASINKNWCSILAKTVEKNMKNIASLIPLVGDIEEFLTNMLHGYDYRISGSLCLRAIIDEKWYKTISERIGTDMDIFICVTSITEARTIIANFFQHLQQAADDDDEDQLYHRTWMPKSTKEKFICVKTFYTKPHPIQLVFVQEDTLSFIQRFDFKFLMNSMTWSRGFELTIATPCDIAGKIANYETFNLTIILQVESQIMEHYGGPNLKKSGPKITDCIRYTKEISHVKLWTFLSKILRRWKNLKIIFHLFYIDLKITKVDFLRYHPPTGQI